MTESYIQLTQLLNAEERHKFILEAMRDSSARELDTSTSVSHSQDADRHLKINHARAGK